MGCGCVANWLYGLYLFCNQVDLTIADFQKPFIHSSTDVPIRDFERNEPASPKVSGSISLPPLPCHSWRT